MMVILSWEPAQKVSFITDNQGAWVMSLRFLVRLSSASFRSREGFLRSVRSLSASVGGSVRNPKWTSYGALEVDVFVNSRPDLDLLQSALEPISKIEFVHDLSEAPPHKSKEEIISEARSYFSSERFWEAHETLEALWRVSSGDEKLLLQGLILVCAAFVHHQKSEEETGQSVLRRASRQLNWPQSSYGGIDLEELRGRVQMILATRRFQVFRV